MNKSVRDENGLNKRERDILKYIQKEMATKGYAPSVREIGKAVKLSSTATVQGYLKELESKGFIKKENQKGRTLRLLRDSKGEDVNSQPDSDGKDYYNDKELVDVPVIGRITAGQPILDVIKKQGLKKTAIVVTRYFGGIKLGAGGLVGAYSEAASDVLGLATILEKKECKRVAVKCDYSTFSAVEKYLFKTECKPLGFDYGDEVSGKIVIPLDGVQAFAAAITEITSGRASVEILDGITFDTTDK